MCWQATIGLALGENAAHMTTCAARGEPPETRRPAPAAEAPVG
jgi:hypothetical protein